MIALLEMGAMPFTADDIAADLGIEAGPHRGLIECVIAVVCGQSTRPVMSSKWAVSADEGFERRSMRGAVAPVSIGPIYQAVFNLGRPDLLTPARDCTYAPDPAAVRAAPLAVAARLMRHSDKSLGLAISRAIAHA